MNMGGSQKYRNVEANGQAAFVVDDLEADLILEATHG